MSKIRITYACFLNASGYSFSAQHYLAALEKTGMFDIKIRIFGSSPSRPSIGDDQYRHYKEMVNKPDDPDRILIYHCIPTIQKRIKGYKKTIGFATFETVEPPENWIQILNKNDAIIVPSEFNNKIFSHTQIQKPIYTIPHCLDFEQYDNEVLYMYEYEPFTFIFMGIFRERKGYKQLIEAFFTEFSDTDNVQLIIKTDKTEKARAYIEKVKKQMGINKGFAPIILENKVFEASELPSYLKSMDCLVSPTMGEGFGLPAMQCMALGVPVIVTNYSGCQEYANDKTATLLEPNGFVFRSNMDNIPQFNSKKWAFLEVSKIREAMRYACNNPANIHRKANWAYSYVRNKFNYKIVGNLFVNMIREIYG